MLYTVMTMVVSTEAIQTPKYNTTREPTMAVVFAESSSERTLDSFGSSESASFPATTNPGSVESEYRFAMKEGRNRGARVGLVFLKDSSNGVSSLMASASTDGDMGRGTRRSAGDMLELGSSDRPI